MTALVSTIIPVYNRPEMLREAAASVLAQTYRPIEVIISDDGSIDRTGEVAQTLVREHPGQIRLVRGENRGPGPAREAGRQLARGQFIQYLDSDDRLLPDKFATQVQALRENPDCGVAYGYTRLVDDRGGVLKDIFKWTGRDIPHLFPGLLIDRWWCTHTPLYRREVCDRVGPWSGLRWSQDWEYDARVGSLGTKLINVHRYVSEHRHHAGQRQTSAAAWRTDSRRLHNRVQLLELLWQHAETGGVDVRSAEAQHFARWAFQIARDCARAGLPEETALCLTLAEKAGSAGAGSRGVRLFRLISRLCGQRLAGELARRLESIKRSPGRQTLPQSFTDGSSPLAA